MLSSEFNNERLREARMYREKSISEIGEVLNVTKQTISKYENGQSNPSLETIFLLVDELEFVREFYFSEDNFYYENENSVLSTVNVTTLKERMALEYHQKYICIIRDYLSTFIELPKLDVGLQNRNLKPREYAKYIREVWELGDKPVIDMMNLLESKGFVMDTVSTRHKRINTFSSHVTINNNNYYAILLEKNKESFYDEQQILAIELGHWLMHDKLLRKKVVTKEMEKQLINEVNEFALSFLLPNSSFGQNIRTNPTDLDQYLILKKFWNISVITMLNRAKTEKIISDVEYNKLKRQYNYRGWRKEEPLDHTEFSQPVLLKQSIELLVENEILKGYDIPREILKIYNIALSGKMTQKMLGIEEGYLEYTDPQIVKRDNIK